MLNIIISWLKLVGIVSFVVLICYYIYYRLVTAKYWSKRNVPHLKPKFLLGSMWRANIFENAIEVFAKMHLENKDKKMVGIWTYHVPNLVVTDLGLIKRILISDFNYFRDRGMELDEKKEPLAGHLFLMGGKRWRNLRVKLTPTFTSGKMKMMFPTIMKCGDELREYLRKPADGREVIEVKDLMARYATDVIGSCAFGIEANTLQNPKSEFREYGGGIFKTTYKQTLANVLVFSFPTIAKILGIRFIPKDVSDFFLKVVDDTIQYREKTQTVRNDFLQILIQLMRAGKIEDVDKTPLEGLKDEEIVYKFSLHEAAAQCFVFFLGGFETSSTALTFALYELALNPNIQTRLQDEIDSMLSEGDITYEKLIGMEYLDMVVQETLRKHPSVGNLQRQCLKEYRVPEMNTTIEKGRILFISVLGIHKDPEIYPDPEKFDPERFRPEEKAKRDPCTFLSFGEGPRNCIGNRFGLLQMKVALLSMLRDYNVEVTKTTPIPVVYQPKGLVLGVKGGMYLTFTKRR